MPNLTIDGTAHEIDNPKNSPYIDTDLTPKQSTQSKQERDLSLSTSNIENKPKGKPGRPKGKQNTPTVSQRKGYLIGKELAKGLKSLDAVRAVGYKTDSRTTAGKIIHYTDARKWAEHFLTNKADKVLENLTESAIVDKTPQIMEALKSGDTATARVLVDLLKLSYKNGQDLLDRAGISKVTKHMTVRKDITDKHDLKSIDDSINALMAKLGMSQNGSLARVDKDLSPNSPISTHSESVNTNGHITDMNAMESKPEGMETILSTNEAEHNNSHDMGAKMSESLESVGHTPQKVERGSGVENHRTTHTHTFSNFGNKNVNYDFEGGEFPCT